MGQLIDAVATGIGDGIGALAGSGALFALFAILWIAFGAALIWSQGSLDAAWQWIQALPILIQVVVWLLFLPVVAGLWIWETTWPLLARIVLIVGIAGWNLLIFFPRGTRTVRP
jgi:hypothetical protein